MRFNFEKSVEIFVKMPFLLEKKLFKKYREHFWPRLVMLSVEFFLHMWIYPPNWNHMRKYLSIWIRWVRIMKKKNRGHNCPLNEGFLCLRGPWRRGAEYLFAGPNFGPWQCHLPVRSGQNRLHCQGGSSLLLTIMWSRSLFSGSGSKILGSVSGPFQRA